MAAEVPIVDLAAPRDELVEAVRAAFSATSNAQCPGMLRLKMSALHAAQLRAVHAESRQFFELPAAAKGEYLTAPGYPSGPHRCGGYKPQKAYEDADGRLHMLNEWFVAGCPRPIDRSVEPSYYNTEEGRHFFADDTPRNWPAEVPGLRPAADEYFLTTERVCFQLLDAFEAVLGCEPGELLNRARREPFYVTTIAHYPEQSVPPPEGQMRIDPHYDQSFFALVGTCDAGLPSGNLEVRGMDDEWREVGLGEGELVLNCGEQLARLSNGMLHHAVHRVQNPQPTAEPGSTSRISVMTYYQVDYDAAITPLPSSVAASGIPPKYPESRAGELILYTDPELSELLGYDLEAQNKMRIAQGLYDEASNMMAVARPSDYTEVDLDITTETLEEAGGLVGVRAAERTTLKSIAPQRTSRL